MVAQVQLDYQTPVNSPQIPAFVKGQFQTTPLNYDELPVIGCSFISDTTTEIIHPSVIVINRRILISLFPTPNVYVPVATEAAAYKGTISSSNPNDTVGGSGLQQVRINFTLNGQADYEIVDMKGTTPVQMIKLKDTIVSFESLKGTAVGFVAIYTGNVVNNATNGDQTASIPNDWTGSIVSTSSADSPSEISTVVTISYLDSTSTPQTEVVILNGQHAVNLVNSNKRTITNIQTSPYNNGLITIYSGPNLSGFPMGQFTPSFFAYFPPGTDQKAPWRDLFTHTLAQGIGFTVTALDPVIT